MNVDDNTPGGGARWRYLRGKSWIALLGAIAMLTTGAQALAAAPASAAINNGGNCVEEPWLPECQPTGGGGDGSGGSIEPDEEELEEQQLEEEEELDEEEQEIEEEEEIQRAEEEEKEISDKENREIEFFKRLEEIYNSPNPVQALQTLNAQCETAGTILSLYAGALNTVKALGVVDQEEELEKLVTEQVENWTECRDLYIRARRAIGLPPLPEPSPVTPPTVIIAREITEQIEGGAHPTQVAMTCPRVPASSTRACSVAVTDLSASPTTPTGTVRVQTTSGGGHFGQSPAQCTLAASGAKSATCTITYVPSAGGGELLTAAYERNTGHASSGAFLDLTPVELEERQQREAQERQQREAEERQRRETEERQLREMERREREERERREREHIIER